MMEVYRYILQLALAHLGVVPVVIPMLGQEVATRWTDYQKPSRVWQDGGDCGRVWAQRCSDCRPPRAGSCASGCSQQDASYGSGS